MRLHRNEHDVSQCLANVHDEIVAANDSDLWLTYDTEGTMISMHIGPEPEFSQDEGLDQVNVTIMAALERTLALIIDTEA